MEVDQETLRTAIESIWKNAVESNRHADALAIGVLSYLVAQAIKDVVFERESLILIRSTLDAVLTDRISAAKTCSFCGSKPPDIQLGGGANNAYICSSCVDLFYQAFHGSK